jgi:AraC-like DNA-binding protein
MTEQQNISIPERLRPFISQVWTLDASDVSIYADGCPGIIFQQTDSSLILNDNKKLSPVFLYGQTVQPIRIAASGSAKMIVVCFHPHVVHSIFRLSAKEITDDCLDLSLLSPVPGINLTERLWNTGTPEQQTQILFDYMQQVIIRNRSTVDAGMEYAATRLWQSGRQLPLKKLQQTLNLSERTFQRKFEQCIGIPPRLFSKISQFQSALGQLRSGNFFKLSDIAYDNGYADQSHFIRDFKKFTGLSPLAFQKLALNALDKKK